MRAAESPNSPWSLDDLTSLDHIVVIIASEDKVVHTLVHTAARKLLQTYDCTPNTLRGSGATDWTSFEDRMNFIIDYFRSRQQTLNLLQPPFCAEQVEAMKAGRIPADGSL